MKLWAMPCWPPKMDDSWSRTWRVLTKLVHWRREWETTSIFLHWESHEQYEKAKRYDTERWTPWSVTAEYATGDQWRNNSRKNEEMEPKQKQHPAVDVTGDGNKFQCCKKQYCIGTWNLRSMNQGNSEVVKQEMARVNIYISGISELKWIGMGKFNSDDHYIYYCGQESLRRNGVATIVNKSPKCSTWVQFQKGENDLYSFPRQTIQYHSNPSRCPNK